MSESRLFDKLKRATEGFHWQRHEDKFHSGIPDCSFGHNDVCGWVELKTYDNWPIDPNKHLVFSDLKPSQVNWCIARGEASGSVWFLVLIESTNEWFLISYRYARQLGKLTKKDIIDKSSLYGKGPLSKELKKILLEY